MSLETRLWFNLLDKRSMGLVGSLTGITGGSITADMGQAITETGSMTAPNEMGEVNWSEVLVQPWREVNGVSWPVGVYVPTIPKLDHNRVSSAANIQLADRTILLQRAEVEGEFSIPAGSSVLTEIRNLISWVGFSPDPLTDQLGTTRSDLVWDPGTSVLSVINQLLSWQNYRRLTTDTWGRWQVRKAMRFEQMPVTEQFVSGPEFPYTPMWGEEEDLSEIPNAVTVWVQGDNDKPPLRATAYNDDPDDPLSIPNRGRVSYSLTAECTTQAETQELANRTLEERRLINTTLTIEHPWKDLELGTLARFANDRRSIDRQFVMSKTVKPLEELTLQKTTLGATR